LKVELPDGEKYSRRGVAKISGFARLKAARAHLSPSGSFFRIERALVGRPSKPLARVAVRVRGGLRQGAALAGSAAAYSRCAFLQPKEYPSAATRHPAGRFYRFSLNKYGTAGPTAA
jgi:hypothetical protein